MNRAYSLLTVKAVNDEKRIITGVATTPEPDRVGDVVEPLGVKFNNPMPLLHQHDSEKPVGTVKFDKPTKDGITFTAQLPIITEPGPLKDRVDTAWGEVKAGLVRAVSIGFRALEYAFIEGTNGIRFLESEVLELSLVSIPANAGATITQIKSIDTTIRAASGIKDGEGRPVSPGKSGTRKSSVPLPKEGNKMSKSIGQQIADLEASRGAKAARAEEIMTKASAAGRSTAADEQEEFDTLDGEITALDADITRLKSLEKMQARKATAVADIRDPADATHTRSGVEFVRSPKLDKGIQFTRYVRCQVLSRVAFAAPAEIAKQYYPADDVLGRMLKTAIPGATTGGTYWGGPLVPDEVTTAIADFVDYLRPRTILGQFGQNGIPALRNVPFYTPLLTEQAISTAAWSGEGTGIKVSKGGYTRTTLTPLKLGAIDYLSIELMQRSSPAADALIRDQLTKAIAAKLDGDFIDPAVAASAGVSPASVTYGVGTNHSSGNTADDVRADVKTLKKIFLGANNQMRSGVLIMPSDIAVELEDMRNAMGNPEFPDITMSGGKLSGLPVIVSDYVPTVTAGSYVVLANAEDIYLGDEGGVMISASGEASLEATDAPSQEISTPTASATNMISMFQTDSVAIKATRIINWAKRRSHAVQVLDQVNWGAASS